MRFRFLLKELVTRDLRVRYAGSLLGFVWAFANPLWQLGLYSVVFSAILRMELVGEGTRSFPAFLFAGLLPWIAISESLSRGTATVVENAQLVKKHAFPSELLVTAVTLSSLVHAAIALLVFVLFRLFVASVTWGELPALLLGVVFQIGLTLGVTWFLAAVYVYLRDVQHVLTFLLSALFYLTPMIYPVALVPERFRGAVESNPLSTIVAFYRAFLLGSQPPAPRRVAELAVVAILVCAGGLAFFRRFSKGFADEL